MGFSKVQAQLAADVQHICATKAAFAALKSDGSVVAWGAGPENWVVGLGDCGGDCSKVQDQLADVQNIYPTRTAFAALKADGRVVSWGLGCEEAEALAGHQ